MLFPAVRRSVLATLWLMLPTCLAGTARALPQVVGCLWEARTSAPIGRFEAGCLVIDDQLYVFGGFDTLAIEATARSDRYDPDLDAWERLADLPTPITHSPFVQEGRRVWLMGGFVGDHPGTATAAVWIYDIDLDTWTAGPSLPRPIASGGAVLLGRSLHYFSGCEADRVTMSADHWAFDLDAPGLGWQARAPMPEPRCHFGVAKTGGDAWVVGGQVGHDVSAFDVPYVHRYAANLDSWTEEPSLPRPRSHFEAATFTNDGKIYVAGGQNQTIGRGLLNGTLELDPSTGTWTYVPQLPFPRQATCAQSIGDYLYMTGGSNPGTPPASDLYRRKWVADLPTPFRINCGGPEIQSFSASCCWCGDIGAEGGVAASFDPTANIIGTEDDAAFHAQRRSEVGTDGPVDYRFPMGNGFFRVRALFAERVYAAPGQRVLDLTVENRRQIESLDLAAQAGYETAYSRAFDVEVVDHVLNVSVGAAPSQTAMLAALEIERLDEGHFASLCTGAPSSTGLPGELGFIGNSSVAENDLTFHASGLPTNTFGLLVQARMGGQFQLPGGVLCLAPPIFRLPPTQAVGSDLHYQLPLANPPLPSQTITAGSTWHFQCWYRDGGRPEGYGLTGDLRISFTP